MTPSLYAVPSNYRFRFQLSFLPATRIQGVLPVLWPCCCRIHFLLPTCSSHASHSIVISPPHPRLTQARDTEQRDYEPLPHIRSLGPLLGLQATPLAMTPPF